MAYLDPASNPRSKPQRCVLKIAKAPLQISFKHSEPFLAFFVKNYLHEITLFFVLKGNFMQEKSRNLSGKQGEESMI